MTDVRTLHRKWMKSPTYRKAYENLQAEFELAEEMIGARARAGMSQQDVAKHMRTTQSAVARIESGKHWPSRRTLERYAKATGTRPIIKLVAAE